MRKWLAVSAAAAAEPVPGTKRSSRNASLLRTRSPWRKSGDALHQVWVLIHACSFSYDSSSSAGRQHSVPVSRVAGQQLVRAHKRPAARRLPEEEAPEAAARDLHGGGGHDGDQQHRRRAVRRQEPSGEGGEAQVPSQGVHR